MLPPHCGQTKLMIEEIMLELGSPGIVSIILIVAPCHHVAFSGVRPRYQHDIANGMPSANSAIAAQDGDFLTSKIRQAEQLAKIWQVTGIARLAVYGSGGRLAGNTRKYPGDGRFILLLHVLHLAVRLHR